jgi:hypothetical protein
MTTQKTSLSLAAKVHTPSICSMTLVGAYVAFSSFKQQRAGQLDFKPIDARRGHDSPLWETVLSRSFNQIKNGGVQTSTLPELRIDGLRNSQ